MSAMHSQNVVAEMLGINKYPSLLISASMSKRGSAYASPEAMEVKMSFTVLALFLSLKEGEISLDIEQ